MASTQKLFDETVLAESQMEILAEVDGLPLLCKISDVALKTLGATPIVRIKKETLEDNSGQARIHKIVLEVYLTTKWPLLITTAPNGGKPTHSIKTVALAKAQTLAESNGYEEELAHDPYQPDPEPEEAHAEEPTVNDATETDNTETDNTDEGPVYFDGFGKEDWPPFTEVRFGRYRGRSLEEIMERFGPEALGEYYWRGVGQIKQGNYPNVNKAMCALIVKLWASRGINTPLRSLEKVPPEKRKPRAAKAPGTKSGGRGQSRSGAR